MKIQSTVSLCMFVTKNVCYKKMFVNLISCMMANTNVSCIAFRSVNVSFVLHEVRSVNESLCCM